MKASALKYAILSITAVIITLILILVPFHAFLTVWAASTFGHYTAFLLWEEYLLVIAGIGALYLVVFDRKVRLSTLYHGLTWLIAGYLVVQLVWGLGALHYHTVDAKAVAYGVLVNSRFLIFFLAAWVVGSRTKRLANRWSWVLLWPAVIVIVFGILQVVVLPVDFLKHVGYSSQTILPYETINHNAHYVRIMSTLRGANPFGAYLLLPISALVVLMAVGKRNWQRLGMLLGAIVTLFFTFSRSAWVGAVLSGATVPLTRLRSLRVRRWWGAVAVGLLVVLVGVVIGFRHNTRLQNVLFHTQTHSAVATTSDQGHASALKAGLHDLIHEPLGRGPGTAGPASVYNNHPARIAENYYIQIGQEVGWLGLLLFAGINAYVAVLLWQRRQDPLALTLLASLIGISFVNLLSHAWTDETLAFLWWGLAGIAIGAAAHDTDGQGSEAT
ncbi:MAG TPA: O-antigen ligase family protein [Candidatus Saccharimonadales bacterium]|nr:O-antigen ligase family protein [Candidatus Saccharimonadales bacterium]